MKIKVNLSDTFKEIEFVCVNPTYKDSTPPKAQENLYRDLSKIKDLILLWQDWSHLEDGQKSLAAIYADDNLREVILNTAAKHGVKIDLEQSVTNEYAKLAAQGKHEGQIVG